MDILVGLYEQVEEFVSEGRLKWVVLCGSGLLVSVVELAVTWIISVCCLFLSMGHCA